MLSPFQALGLPLPPVAVGLNLGCFALTVVVTAGFAGELVRGVASARSSVSQLPIAACFLALNYTFASFGTSGLETMLGTLLLLALAQSYPGEALAQHFALTTSPSDEATSDSVSALIASFKPSAGERLRIGFPCRRELELLGISLAGPAWAYPACAVPRRRSPGAPWCHDRRGQTCAARGRTRASVAVTAREASTCGHERCMIVLVRETARLVGSGRAPCGRQRSGT